MGFFRAVKHFFIPTSHNAYRPHSLGRSSLLFVLALILVVEGFLAASIVGRPFIADFLSAVIGSEIISLTNTQRAEASVGALKENPILDAAAQAKADDMAAKEYFSHVGPDGKEPWAWISEAGYEYSVAGENLAVRFIDSSDVVSAWMASPTHKANIVKATYQEIGVGVAQGTFQGAPATYVVQFFGTARPLAAAYAPQPVAQAPAPAVETPAPRPTPVQAPQVAGESVSAPAVPAPQATHPTPSPENPLRVLLRALAEPRASTAWVLSGIVALLVLALGLAVLIHIQIQPGDLLLRGSLVALLALFLIAANAQVLGSSLSASDQAAAVAASGTQSAYAGLLIGSGASTQAFAVVP